MIVVILVGIIPIRSWINEEEMRVDKGFHKTKTEAIHDICGQVINEKNRYFAFWVLSQLKPFY